MIPYATALFAYIPFAALLMLDRNSARGFSLAYLLALFLLPSTANPVTESTLGTIALPLVPDLDKGNIPTIGVLLGTIIFHPERFDRFRLSPYDFLLLVVLQFTFVTSYLNGFGAYDGISHMLKFILNFMLIVFLARIHIGTPTGLRTFMICMCVGAACCAPFALWEFRFSPQIHTELYGYFQHVFQQHIRGGFYRPILAFTHGLVLARFFAITAFLALFPMRRDLADLFGPLGGYLFLAPLAGLLVSMSLSPYMVFAMLCVGWFVVQRYRWAYYVLPIIGFLWIIAFFVDIEIGFSNVHQFFGFSAERAESLEYRLVALREYKAPILARGWFGWGGWNSAHTGRATDSVVLIYLINFGFMGAIAYFGWWFCMLTVVHRVKDAAAGTVLGGRARAVALMCSLGLLISVVDSALDTYLLILVSALLSIDGWLSTNPQIPTLPGYRGPRAYAPASSAARLGP